MKEKALMFSKLNSDFEQSELWNENPNVVTALEQQSDQNPTKIALVDGDVQITYQELNQQANQLATYLLEHDITAGSIVGVCIAQSARRIIAFLAVLKSGAAYLPIDGELPEARINFMIEDAAVDFLLTEDLYQDKIERRHTRSVSLDLLHYNADFNNLSKENIDVNFDPESTSYVIYTSGSTGVPKGVMIGHRSFFHFVMHQAAILGIDHHSKTLQFASPSFDAAVIDIWVPLVNGATVYLYPNNKIVGESLLDYIVAHNIDTVPLMPPMVLASLPTNKSIGQLHTIGIGGEACTEATVKAWYKKIKLINSYGPTEATVAVTNYEFKEEPNPRIIGNPVPYAHLFVLDENLIPVGTAVAGELYVGGLPLALGYLNRPEDTEKSFIEAPEWLHGKLGEYRTLYKTGDIVQWRSDGNLEFSGRRDEQVKIRGYRIELAEIEHHMTKLPQIQRAAIKVQQKANGLPSLIAFVQFAEHQDLQTLTHHAVKTKLQQVMPAYMIPDKIVFVEKMALTHAGKIDKAKLIIPETVSEASPMPIWNENNLRDVVQHIWSELLDITEVHDDDDFFELGGYSLLVAHWHVLLPEKVRNRITLPELYLYTTLSSFVTEVENRLKQVEVSQKIRAQEMERELIQDAQLHTDFNITTLPDPAILANPKYIFLTGVTGFVGSHLLEELLKNTTATIYSLVRAANAEDGIQRIKDTFAKFKLPWLAAYDHRTVAVIGDLSVDKFGISDQDYDFISDKVEVIYHSGSSVSYVQPYSLIKKPNIDGLHHIIELAVHQKTKYLVLLSSMGVFSWGRPFTQKTWMYEDDSIYQNMPAITRDLGYIKSKWVMESIAEKAKAKGLPIINFRLGFAVCHSTSGATVMNQWWGALIRSCVQLKSFPLVMGLKDELTTVDYMCKAIVHISKKKESVGLNFHLSPLAENDVSLTDFCSKMKEYYDLKLDGMEYHQWLEQWINDDQLPIYPLLALFTEDIHEGKCLVEAYENTYYYDRSNTKRFLADSDLEPPVFDEKLMTPYLKYMGVIKD
ncbi:non-ribosomal peptide synthetase family protein [Sphingobacterium chungjuense]|uniref:non-ribosomal peptide synthetase family protein n=1 Tax=Sphingobacterium chungjuense TaxID=2675553 RepID=UPI001F0E6453|nr:amino acid adenylation domain-containing protein [Sphingobacterium chungjuense]